jgi:uncharacterized cupin superfamily protein
MQQVATSITTTTITTAAAAAAANARGGGRRTRGRSDRNIVTRSKSQQQEQTTTKQIRVEKNRKKEEFSNWPVWGCEASTFPWTYGSTEQCYILKGKVIVTPDENPEEAVTLEEGDFAEMPQGLSCTWDVLEDISKNYKFV